VSGIGKGFPLRKICDCWGLGSEGTTMGMSYSNDLRLRVPVDGGVPVRQIAALLRVSVSYIYKALIRRRRMGETGGADAVRTPAPQPREP
jgi:hypothetical protein